MNVRRMWLWGMCVAVGGAASAATIQDDDFNDNAIGSRWSLIQDSGNLTLAEQNQRLEASYTAGGSVNDDAIYLSNGVDGFRLATDQDFAIRLDYSFSPGSAVDAGVGEGVAVVFGVGRDVDGTDAAAIGRGVTNAGFNPALETGVLAVREGDVQSTTLAAVPAAGTFEISYDAAGDVLTLGTVGGAGYAEAGLVRGVWNADSLLVSMGVRGKGFSLAGTTLDDFRIVEGRVVPEPALAGLLPAAALLGWRGRGARRGCV